MNKHFINIKVSSQQPHAARLYAIGDKQGKLGCCTVAHRGEDGQSWSSNSSTQGTGLLCMCTPVASSPAHSGALVAGNHAIPNPCAQDAEPIACRWIERSVLTLTGST